MLAVQTLLPDHRLRPFLHAYVQRESRLAGTAELVEPVVARLGAVLEFQFADPYDVPIYGRDAPNPSAPITVIGAITYRRARILIRGHVEALAVLFRPLGFHALFRIPVAPLTDEGTEGHGLIGRSISALHEQLGNTAGFPDRARTLDRYFLGLLDRVRPVDAIGRALDLLMVPGPMVPVASVARQVGVSVRRLERSALDLAGMPPKTLSRIARFQRAIRLKDRSHLSWTDVAHAMDYYDQMHMIRDFRAFAGHAPGRAMKDHDPSHLGAFMASEDLRG